MPDTYIRFSDMAASHPSPMDGANDLLAIAHVDQNSTTGYNSMTVTPNQLGAHAVEDQTFVNLQTNQKTVEGDINELKNGKLTVTDLTGTLLAGQTSLTISNAAITTTSIIEVFNDLDVPYNSKTLLTGSITLTFDEQASDMSVMVRVS